MTTARVPKRISIDFCYDSVEQLGFHSKYLGVSKNGKYGVIVMNDNIQKSVIPIEYEDVSWVSQTNSDSYHNPLFLCKRGGKWGVLDKSNRIIVSFGLPSKKSITKIGEFFIVELGDEYYILDNNGFTVFSSKSRPQVYINNFYVDGKLYYYKSGELNVVMEGIQYLDAYPNYADDNEIECYYFNVNGKLIAEDGSVELHLRFCYGENNPREIRGVSIFEGEEGTMSVYGPRGIRYNWCRPRLTSEKRLFDKVVIDYRKRDVFLHPVSDMRSYLAGGIVYAICRNSKWGLISETELLKQYDDYSILEII